MVLITVYLHNGELKNEWDGHYYNDHLLVKDQNNSVNPTSSMTEISVCCMMCDTSHSKRIYTDSNPKIDELHAYLVGQFDEPCPAPRKEIAHTAKCAWEDHKGEPFTDSVRLDMKDRIESVADTSIDVVFE